jgi:hypothetical protein
VVPPDNIPPGAVIERQVCRDYGDKVFSSKDECNESDHGLILVVGLSRLIASTKLKQTC